MSDGLPSAAAAAAAGTGDSAAAAAAAAAPSDAKAHLRSLIARKDELEALLEAASSQARGGERLVDADGFPRADIDVHAVRQARADMARLQTDHQSVMRDIERAMFSLHAEARAAKLAANPAAVTRVPVARPAAVAAAEEPQGAELEARLRADAARADERRQRDSDAQAAAAGVGSLSLSSGATTTSSGAVAPAPVPAPTPASTSEANLRPFYRVASVSADSPAESAGLQVGDLVLQFGSVRRDNASAQAMASVVSSSIGRNLVVMVERGGQRKELLLRPQQWGGRGMLGCHLVDM